MVSNGKNAAKKITRARILLKADTGEHGPGYKDEAIEEALDLSFRTASIERKIGAVVDCQDRQGEDIKGIKKFIQMPEGA